MSSVPRLKNLLIPLAIGALALAALVQPALSVTSAFAAVTERFVGSIAGSPVDATIRFEQIRERVLMTGRLESDRFAYVLRATVIGAAGSGELVDQDSGARHRIAVRLTSDGFELIAKSARVYSFSRNGGDPDNLAASTGM